MLRRTDASDESETRNAQLHRQTRTHIHAHIKPNSITLAGSKLVADMFEAKFHHAIWFKPAPNVLA